MLLNKSLLTLVLGTSVMMMSVSVDARHYGGMYNKHSAERHQMMMEQLGVSEEQRAKLDKLHEQRKEVVNAHQKKMQALMKEQRQMMQQDTLDKGKLQSNLRKQADIRAEMMADRHEHYKEVQKILTVEQRAKMNELRDEMYEKRKEMREQAYERRKENKQ